MTAKEIYFKTRCFNWLKLALGFAMILASLVLLALCLGLGWLFGTRAWASCFSYGSGERASSVLL